MDALIFIRAFGGILILNKFKKLKSEHKSS
jgi:hypothetical protein